MAYYSVAAVTDRRVNDVDGSVEYAVKWAGYGKGEGTWERRQYLTENCAELVQQVDQQCMDATDEALNQWRQLSWETTNASATSPDVMTATGPSPTLPVSLGRKRSRSPARSNGTTTLSAVARTQEGEWDEEVLTGLLLRAPHRAGVKGEEGTMADTEEEEEEEEEAVVLMLGEVVLAEDAAAALNCGGSGHRKRRQQPAAKAAVSLNTAPAREVERRWREMHGHSLLHSVEVSRHVTLFHEGFELRLQDAETQRLMAQEAAGSSHLRVVGIAPPHVTYSGAVFGAPVVLDGLVGEKDVEDMRLSVQLESPLYGGTAQEITKPRVEQMVVRYMISETSSPTTTASGTSPLCEPCAMPGYVASMPLSVFRLAFPQLLIDFLLENSVVLH
jgi:hypothetical protein